MPNKDIDIRRALDRERSCRRTAERVAMGHCPRCGSQPPEADRSVCAACSAKRRAAGIGRARDPNARQAEYARARQRAADRLAQGLCGKCGRHPHEPDRRPVRAPALSRNAAPGASDTGPGELPAGPTAAAIRNPGAVRPARGAGSASAPAARHACASDAATILPSRADRVASRASGSAGPPTGRRTPLEGQRDCAGDAVCRRSRACLSAVHARWSRPGAKLRVPDRCRRRRIGQLHEPRLADRPT